MDKNLFLHDNITTQQTVMSQITGVVRDYLLFNLPKKYFKNIHIGGALRQVEDVNSSSEEYNDMMKENPSLQISPQLRFDYMGGNHTTNHIMFQGNRQLYSNLRYMDVLFTDDTLLNYVRYENRRFKVNFDIEIRVETQMSCYDLIGYFKQRMPANYNFFINDVPLIIAIPNDIVYYLSNFYGKDINDASELRQFINILDNKSTKPIDYKINPQSGNKTIQFIEKMNLLCKVEDEPQMNQVEVGRSIDDNTITFQISAELSYPSLFVLLSYKDPELLDEQGRLIDHVLLPQTDPEYGTQVSLNYLVRIRPDYTLLDSNGKDTTMNLSFHQQYLTDINTQTETLPMSGILDPQIEFYIDTVYADDATELSNTNHFKMFVYEDGSNLPEYTERSDGMGGTIRDYNWVVDWNKKIVTLLSPKRNYNYSICLYIDMVRMKPVLEAHNKYDMSVFDTIK